jgi:hypothetical protein
MEMSSSTSPYDDDYISSYDKAVRHCNMITEKINQSKKEKNKLKKCKYSKYCVFFNNCTEKTFVHCSIMDRS